MVLLNLGDIIRFIAPENDDIHEQTFFIDYIDSNKLKVINVTGENLTKQEILLRDGNFADESIKQVELLSSSPENGFARQNRLLPNTWINIHFGGDIPQIIVGEITNLEEDMIELRTFPERDYIYIDFAYQGIPEDLPIIKIEIREKPSFASSKEAIAIADEEDAAQCMLKTASAPPQAAQEEEAPPIEEEPAEINIRDNARKLFFTADEIVLGEELEKS